MKNIHDDTEDEESYSRGLEMRPNTSGEYATYAKWQRELEEDNTCAGKFRRWRHYMLIIFFRLNSYLAAYLTVIITSGVYFASLQAGNDDLSAFAQSFLSGVVVATVFVLFTETADRCSRFPEHSTKHVQNDVHWSRGAVFICYLIGLIISSFALKNINDYCMLTQKPCHLKHAFIPPN